MKPFPLRLPFGPHGLLLALGYGVISCTGLVVGVLIGLRIGGNTAPFKYAFSMAFGLLMAYEVYRNFKLGWIAFTDAAPTRRLYAPNQQAHVAMLTVAYSMGCLTAVGIFLILDANYQVRSGCLALLAMVAAGSLAARFLGMWLGWNRAYQAWRR